MYDGINDLKRSWPAVSQSWSLIVRSSRYIVLDKKSMPVTLIRQRLAPQRSSQTETHQS